MSGLGELVPVDGRSARGLRTRAAIVAAHVDLLAEGDLRPTAERIAERAGVSLRALWIHFSDLESLFGATAAEILVRQDHAFRPVDPSLPLGLRIERFARQRSTLLDRIAPFARASQLREPFSPVLRDYHSRHISRVVDEIEVLFAGELAAAGPRAARELVPALAAASTWAAWSVLRDGLGLSPQRSRAVMTRSLTALLGPLEREPDEREAS